MRTKSILIKLNILILINIVVVYSLIGFHYFQTKQLVSQSNPEKDNISEQIAKKFLDHCQGSRSKEQCYAEQFKEFSANNNIKQSVAALNSLQSIDPDARGCHLISHIISGTETDKDFTKWRQLISEVPASACTGGFIHGIIESVSSNDPTFYLDGGKIDEICKFIGSNQKDSGMSNCSHIMGHILLAQEHGSIVAATDICDQVQQSLKYECYSGVFMENMTRVNLIAHGVSEKIPWNTDTISIQEQICSQAKNNISSQACWRELAHMYTYVSHNSPQAVYDMCQKAPSKQSALDCYLHSVGIMSVSGAKIPGIYEKLCKPMQSQAADRLKCIQWAIGSMLSSSSGFIDEALLLCNSAHTTDQPACFQRIVSIINQHKLDSTQNTKLCQKINTHYKIQCP